jgi:hypothetical protein
MIRRILLVLALTAAASASATAAHAMRPPRPPTPLYPPELDTPQSALSDTWTVSCRSRTASHCNVHGVFVFGRPTDAPAHLRVIDSPDRSVRFLLTPADEDPLRLRIVDPVVLTLDRVLVDGAPAQADAEGAIPIEPGEKPVTIELFAAVPIHATTGFDYVIPAIHARHLVAHVGRAPSHFGYAIHTAAAARQRPGAYTHDVHVETSDRLRPRTTRRTAATDPASPDLTELTLTHPGSPLHFGGPMLGLGATTGAGGRFRLRTGVEVGWSTWGLASLAFDTDFRGANVLAPLFEASTPALVFIPLSLSVGAGVPIQLTGTPRVGARATIGLHFAFLGLATTFDLWPNRPGDQADVTVMALFTL